ncbi:MAG: hypothetical protein IJS53_00930 [Clostridia bacterium]|nr:hypothetical protein [Clostridia bacterium]
MKKALCLLLCLGLLPLSGCAGRVELALMVVCLGVDADENGVTLTVKAPDYSAAAQDQDAKKGYLTLSVTGADWTDAAARLTADAPLPLRFGQLREVAVSLDSLQYLPLETLLSFADRLPNVRAHAQVFLCEGTARALVERQEPQVGKRLSKYLDLSMQHAAQQGDIPDTTLAQALRDLTGPWRDPLVAGVAAQAEGKGLLYRGGWAVGAGGTLLPLSAREVQLFRLATGKEQSLLFEYQGRHYAASLRGSAEKRVENANGREALTLRLSVTIFYSEYDAPPPPEAAGTLENELLALLRRLQSAGCDALGFGCEAVRAYATLDGWLASNWPARYAAADVAVELDARYRQQGIL